MDQGAPSRTRQRVQLIDTLRGVALLAMASYHFTWDLEFFGYVLRGTTGHGFWRLYARGIVSTFLFLAGLSLVLAHRDGIRWQPFWRREAQVVAGALAVSIATWFVDASSFVFFGVLHEIAVASLVGLAFLRLPPLATLATGLVLIALPFTGLSTPLTESRWLAWVGLAERPPFSSDYVPLVPFLGIVLLGVAGGLVAERHGILARLAAWNGAMRRVPVLNALGRHALLFYLLHQPLLFGCVWLTAQIWPADLAAQFPAICSSSCLAERDERFCRRYCGCVGADLRRENLTYRLVQNTLTPMEYERVQGMAAQCGARAEPPPAPAAPQSGG
ncbi:DUF1624 domain-containing protein [Mangrovibrevibacter kandeliae]|uniref:DUF1624 domain-containing protein n=1 Tax=Mangrovibrevibacter kandeliae TaxID=2968473 RepID=UPI0021199AA3|nr:DUF1624 domain-containing protein [Aurantimonas sp. CSK15Z-1]